MGEPLTSLGKLEFISLLHNPVVAKRLYKSKEGKTQLKDIQRKAKTFTPGEPLPEATNKNTNAAGLSPDQVRQIKMMIAKAQSLEEVERLNQMLRNGQMPGMETQNGTTGGEQEEMEQ